MKKRFFIGLLHVLAFAHITLILSKDNQSHIEGVLFVAYVLTGALYWKKIAKEKRKAYEKNHK